MRRKNTLAEYLKSWFVTKTSFFVMKHPKIVTTSYCHNHGKDYFCSQN